MGKYILLGATILAVLACFAGIALVFKPTLFLDVQPKTLGSSLARQVGLGGGQCRPAGDDGRYSCGVEIDAGSGIGAVYSLDADDEGCWSARKTMSPAARKRASERGRSPQQYSACVGILDWILPKSPYDGGV